jgi:hypothetical protein
VAELDAYREYFCVQEHLEDRRAGLEAPGS